MSCSAEPPAVFECDVCRCRFESWDAARPLCPQCGFAQAHRVETPDPREFVFPAPAPFT